MLNSSVLHSMHGGDKNHSEFGIFPVPPFCQDKMGSALQDRKTPEGDEKNRKNRLETYSTIFLDSTGIEYARIEWVPPLRGAQPRISGSCFFAMIDWIPSEGGTHSEWVSPLREAQHRISGFCFFAMTNWIPSEGRNPFRMSSAP